MLAIKLAAAFLVLYMAALVALIAFCAAWVALGLYLDPILVFFALAGFVFVFFAVTARKRQNLR